LCTGTDGINGIGDFFYTPMEQKQIINFNITIGKYSAFIDQILALVKKGSSAAVYVANVHMFVEAVRNKSFIKVINEADIVTPDGVPLTWSLKLLHGIKQERVAGMDLLPDLLQQLSLQKSAVYFYGGSPGLLKETEKYLHNTFPHLQVAGLYSPPFRELTNAETAEIAEAINRSGAGIVFVVLGCPKQEKWIASMKGKVNAVMIGIGGALPVLIGVHKRAPAWMQHNGLEWLFRLYQEPNRLWKRYFVTNSFFVYLLLKEKIRLTLGKGRVSV
jgi:N-acetylglucosaminyldiphosphoundecaprenol N-acetyl-beta-D-mannosaminyltransferase